MIEITPRSTHRGRPRTSGSIECARCGRQTAKARVKWPEGSICGICFDQAGRTYGLCPRCGTNRLLPGRRPGSDSPVCAVCADITTNFTCRQCQTETLIYRAGICASCALRNDLNLILIQPAEDKVAMAKLVDAFCASARPESIHTWKRSPIVKGILQQVATGTVPLTHDGLDSLGEGRAVGHLRSILERNGLIPVRDPYLGGFAIWIDDKLKPLPPSIRQPVEKFAKWHHLRRIRKIASDGSPTRGPVHSAKQEITESIKFLLWLDQTQGRTAASCTQLDVDAWLSGGPTTRYNIRTFFVVARKTGLNSRVEIGHRSARATPTLTQDQRREWIGELLEGSSESLPYRVAGLLLLLFAQPLVKVARLRLSDVDDDGVEMTLQMGSHPVSVPEPFARVIRLHVANRPNLRTASGPQTPWIFPGGRAGAHLHPNTIMIRIRSLGIDLRGGRNRALGDLVATVPPAIVADALGYSQQVVHKHAAEGAAQWARYAALRSKP